MNFSDFQYRLLGIVWGKSEKKCGEMSVRVHIGNQLYDVKDIDAVIDMDTNKPNIVIHVDDK